MKVGKITDELKDLIIEQNDLREVAEEYGVVFNSTGKACCPFHEDGKNGNLHIFEKKGEIPTYFCFAETCRAGSVWEDKKTKKKRHTLTINDMEVEDGGPTVIGFVMNIEQCSYIEACVKLMERSGIPVPEGRVNIKHERHKKRMTSLNLQYCKNLFKTPEVMAYITKRGITKSSLKKWRLGYIDEDDFSAPMGEKVAGRLVFGLVEETYSDKAKTVAMAYRTLEDDVKPKYYNDYTMEGLYEKRHYIYGFNQARKAIRKNDYAIVTEGYTDVIIGHQSGIENIVATCGTAFTLEQMEKLRKLTRNLVFWYDGDGPGWDAMIEKIPMLLELGFRIKIVSAPEKDPAEWMIHLGQDPERVKRFIAKKSKSALQIMIEEGIDIYTEYLEDSDSTESQLIEARIDALDYLLPILESITDKTEKIVFRSLVEEKLQIRI